MNELNNLEIKLVSNKCINITINKELSLENTVIKVLNSNRVLMLSVKPTSHTIDVFFEEGVPTFVELHKDGVPLVQYLNILDVFYKNATGDFLSFNLVRN
jgi:hypothetical protein